MAMKLIMNEKALGIISVLRLVWFTTLFEELCFTADEVIVVGTGSIYGRGGALESYRANKKAEKLAELSEEDLLETSIINLIIPKEEIKKVELIKFVRGARINITTNEKKYKWFVRGIPGETSPKIEDYERILQPIFLDKLTVSK
jgi:hypothetical protein